MTIYFLLTAAMRGGAWERGLHRPGAEGWEISQRRRLQIITDLAHHTPIIWSNICLMRDNLALICYSCEYFLWWDLLRQLELNNGLSFQPSCELFWATPINLFALSFILLDILTINLHDDLYHLMSVALLQTKNNLSNYWPQCLQLWWSSGLSVRLCPPSSGTVTESPAPSPTTRALTANCLITLSTNRETCFVETWSRGFGLDNTSLFVFRHDLAQVSGLIYVVTLDNILLEVNIFEMQHLATQ